MSETTTYAPELGPAVAKVISIPAYKLDTFNSKVAVANRRLERAGVDARFAFEFETVLVKKTVGGIELPDGTTFGGSVVEVPWINATQASPLDLTIGDFTFLAALVAEDAGVTVHTAPGHELNGFVPAGDTHCDHCGIDRNRIRLYLVRNNTTGEIIQLGHSCIELFTGLSPKGLFALQFDAELASLGSDDDANGFDARDYAADVDRVIALAFAYSDEGRNYVSAKIDWKVGTGQAVRGHIFGGYPRRGNFGKDEAAFNKAVEVYLAAAAKAEELIADGDLLAEIKASVETVAADSDYGRNLRVILAGTSVSGRNLGILASIVSVYAREKELAVKRAAAPAKAKGFLAPVGTRIKTNIELTLNVVRTREGDYGWSTFLVGTTPDGHTVLWNASKYLDLEVGGTLVLKAASVKAHEQYNGDDQTVLTRCVIAE